MSEGREALDLVLEWVDEDLPEPTSFIAARAYLAALESDRDSLRAEVVRLRAGEGWATRAVRAEGRLAKLEPLVEAAREYERLLALDDIELDPAKNWPAVHAATDRLRAAIRRAYPHH